MSKQGIPFPYEQYRFQEMPRVKQLCGIEPKKRLWEKGTWKEKQIPWNAEFQEFYKNHCRENYVGLSAQELFPSLLLRNLSTGVMQQFQCLQDGKNMMELCETIEKRVSAVHFGVSRRSRVAKKKIEDSNFAMVINIGIRLSKILGQVFEEVGHLLELLDGVREMQSILQSGKTTVDSRREMLDRIEIWLSKTSKSRSSWCLRPNVLYLSLLNHVQELLIDGFGPISQESSLEERVVELQNELEEMIVPEYAEFFLIVVESTAEHVEKLTLVVNSLQTIVNEFHEAAGPEFCKFFAAFFAHGEREQESVGYARLVFRPLYLRDYAQATTEEMTEPFEDMTSSLEAFRPGQTRIHPVFGVEIPMKVISVQSHTELQHFYAQQSQSRMLHPIDHLGFNVYLPEMPSGFSLVTLACPLAIEALEIMEMLCSMDIMIRFDAFFCWERGSNAALRYVNPRYLSWNSPVQKLCLNRPQEQQAAIVFLLALGCAESLLLNSLHSMSGILGKEWKQLFCNENDWLMIHELFTGSRSITDVLWKIKEQVEETKYEEFPKGKQVMMNEEMKENLCDSAALGVSLARMSCGELPPDPQIPLSVVLALLNSTEEQWMTWGTLAFAQECPSWEELIKNASHQELFDLLEAMFLQLESIQPSVYADFATLNPFSQDLPDVIPLFKRYLLQCFTSGAQVVAMRHAFCTYCGISLLSLPRYDVGSAYEALTGIALTPPIPVQCRLGRLCATHPLLEEALLQLERNPYGFQSLRSRVKRMVPQYKRVTVTFGGEKKHKMIVRPENGGALARIILPNCFNVQDCTAMLLGVEQFGAL